ncbi:MAG TPA: peptidoglycan endopeptidase [Rhizorhapis sp.]|nr:peptidoglycan endopeptidase [Rhizorhapis sp.]
MSAMGEVLVREALGLVGVPFRLHGRSVETGVDCVGLVALAAWRAGHRGEAPDRYALRGGKLEQFEAWLKAAGLCRAAEMRIGDIVLVQAGMRQFHLMVFAGAGFVHAHAGLRQVVAMPGESPWPVLGVWRLPG